MKKIRIGNDITIKWTINRQGEPENFSGKPVSVYLLEPFSNTSAPINYTIEGNVITIYFNGKDQKKTGQYTLKLVENEGKAGMITLDICNPFTLVSKSCMAGGYGECSNVDVETIELTSSLDVGKDGKSAYEIALSEGFEGSEAEWLASLKGEKGDTGEQGPKGEKGDTGSKGDKGAPFTYDMFTEEQLESLRGPKGDTGEQGIQGVKGENGDKGDAFTYNDFTPEQIAALKGEKGDTGYIYTPSVDDEGNLSWSNNGGLENPETKNIRGPQGIQGEQGPQGETGPQGEKGETYDDTQVQEAITSLRNALDALTGGDTTSAIDNFNEVVAFLKGIEDSEDLESIIAAIEQQIAAKQDSISDLATIRDGAAKGATALQSYTETDPTVPAWAKAATKPSYTASEVGALPNTTTIPTKMSQLTNDSNYVKSDGNLATFEVVTALPASPEAKTMYIILKS